MCVQHVCSSALTHALALLGLSRLPPLSLPAWKGVPPWVNNTLPQRGVKVQAFICRALFCAFLTVPAEWHTCCCHGNLSLRMEGNRRTHADRLICLVCLWDGVLWKMYIFAQKALMWFYLTQKKKPKKTQTAFRGGLQNFGLDVVVFCVPELEEKIDINLIFSLEVWGCI